MKILPSLASALILFASASHAGDACEAPRASAPAEDLAGTARQALSRARADFKQLARVEREALAACRKIVKTESAAGRALAPTFGAAADLLLAAAAAERSRAGEDDAVARRCEDMAGAYLALARDLGGKRAFPDPAPVVDPEASLARAAQAFARAQELWREAAEEKLSAEQAERIRASWKLMKEGGPRLAALTRTVRTLDAAYRCDTGTCGGKCKEEGQATDVDAAVAKARELSAKVAKLLADAKTQVIIKAPEPAPCTSG